MLKKTTLLFLFVLIFKGIFAQEKIIKAGAILGNLGIQYEQGISERFSILGQVGYSHLTYSVNGTETKSNGIGYYISGKYYLSSGKDEMEGWHIGPYFNSINTKDEDDLKTNISSIGITSGYQWVFNSKITLELLFGLGSFNLNTDVSGIEDLSNINVFPNLGVTFGYAF